MCLFFSFHIVPLNFILCFNAIGFLVCIPYIFFLRYYNACARNRMRLATNITKHSLAAKFQTEENVRSMDVASRLAIVAGGFDALFLLVIVLATAGVPRAEFFCQATEILLFLTQFNLPVFLKMPTDTHFSLTPSSSVSSPSTSDPPSPPSAKCLVCGMPSRGNHFGVLSCRACAAFFRRSWVQKKEYKCRQRNVGKCDVSGNDRYQCRACRLKKCKELGMTPENVQLDRNSESFDDISPDGSFSLALEPVQNSHLYQSLKNPKILIDVTPTLNKLKTILASSMPPLINADYFKLNTLERMRFALWNYRSERKFRTKKWENDLVRIANWLLHSEHFRCLPLEEKMAIFKKIWMRWRKFEKWLISVDTFGHKVYKENVIVCSNYNAANLNKVQIDYSNITDRPNEEMNQLFGKQLRRMQREVAKPLAELSPSTIEMTYMLCQLVWNSLETELDKYSADVGEAFLNEISENLHEHYVQSNIQNYAWRLQKLMKIVNNVKEIEREREEMMKLCELFDVFKIRLSDKDLFIC
ncbi:unnamed protein product [Caenorhabditis sp. 36 PRJEB53466]|nr:unnamed protein product [Caenorhabditis sp. 36 PRJEB53466]